MARPQKAGLDYFPVDVDIDQDDKVALIEAQHGIMGFAVIIKLLMKIYKNSYFYEWTEKEQLLFSKRINVDINQINVIIDDCVKWDLFDSDMLKTFKILTSKGIQKRYLKATDRRQKVEIDTKYLLLDSDDINAYKNLVIVNIENHSENKDDNINPQRKEKESKVKESKELLRESDGEVSCSSDESDNGVKAVYHVYQNSGYGTINFTTKDILIDLIEEYSSEWVIEALKEGLEQNKRTLKYVKGILKNWRAEGGIKTNSKGGSTSGKDRDDPYAGKNFGF